MACIFKNWNEKGEKWNEWVVETRIYLAKATMNYCFLIKTSCFLQNDVL
jgi:hypothetical protein